MRVLGNDGRVSIDDVADRLYALPPEDFVAARDEAAQQADGSERSSIKALRKPTVAAYVVNRLARDRRDDVESLVVLGDDLRNAMTSGGDIRGLSEERRDRIRDLVHA